MRVTPERALALLARILRVVSAPFVRYRIEGGRCIPDLTAAVVAVNHRSMFDVVAGLIGLHHFRRYPRLLIAKEYVEDGWTKPLSQAIGAIPVDRRAKDGSSLAAAIDVLRQGIPIIVMPEGHLHWDEDDPVSTAPPRPGMSRLAVGAGVPMLPAALVGTESVWPATSRLPRLNPFRRKTVVIRVADEPLYLHGEDHHANAELVMAEIRRLILRSTTEAQDRR